MAAALDKLGPFKEQVQPIFVSLDPERDTPEVLRDNVGAFGSEILPLSGTDAQVARAAATFGVVFFRIPEERARDYTIAHSVTIHLVGPEGGLSHASLAPIPSTASPRRCTP
jgi:protein SCO1/2